MNATQLGDFSFGIHLAGGVLYSLFVLPNTLLAFVVIWRNDLHSLLNWAICNVLLSSGLRCLAMSVYCLVKTAQFSPPTFGRDVDFLDNGVACGLLTGSVLLFAHGPLWSVLLLLLTIAIQQSNNKTLINYFTTIRLVELRIIVAVMDVVHICFLLDRIKFGATYLESRCTWQLVLYQSSTFGIFHISLLVGTFIALAVATTLTLKNFSRGGETSTTIFRRSWLTVVVALVVVVLLMCTEFASRLSNARLLLAAETLLPAFMMLLTPCALVLLSDSLQTALLDMCNCRQHHKTMIDGQSNTAFEMELDEGFSELPPDLMVSSVESSQSSPSGESGIGRFDDDVDAMTIGERLSNNGFVIDGRSYIGEIVGHQEYRVVAEVHASADGVT